MKVIATTKCHHSFAGGFPTGSHKGRHQETGSALGGHARPESEPNGSGTA